MVFDQSRVHVAATESSFTFRAELLNGQKSFYRQPCEISHCPEVCDAYVCTRVCSCQEVFSVVDCTEYLAEAKKLNDYFLMNNGKNLYMIF